MKDETTNSYELTLTPNYVSDWNFNDALRELIQNGTDQEVLDPDNEFQIDYSPKEKVLRLKNRKSVLKINTLLLGRSSKANNEDTVGQFGEGYKIAALVLNRLGKTFTIYNNEKNEVWESRFKNSEKWLEKILCFYVSKRKTDDNGLCIEVGNVTQGEFNDLYKVSGMEPGKMSDLRTGMLETNVKTGAPAEENASSLHRVRTQNRK